ncbi:hypothetical protein AMURIS_03769 [Acetatifactor muris]|uniref:YqzN/YkzM domain-containing protein n=1 Tax=Acetatifactor muris TaxID=879566 RepID=A0A2K4ZKR3_9FIRM|nr:hypothetical protein [Lachnospiraceae bacterium]SOY31035.1 hypothetical protein AMURIS_03769 [Acetatifactor muris]
MAKTRNTEENVADRAAEEPAKTSDERKFPYEVLKENCMRLFHVTSSTFIGATIGKENGSYSISEMQRLIDEWLKKEVKK